MPIVMILVSFLFFRLLRMTDSRYIPAKRPSKDIIQAAKQRVEADEKERAELKRLRTPEYIRAENEFHSKHRI